MMCDRKFLACVRKKYSPERLIEHLVLTEAGDVIVDRASVLKDHDDEIAFFIILDHDYGWDFEDFNNSTIYFEVRGGVLYGGVYNIRSGERVSRLPIAAPRGAETLWFVRKYKHDVFDKICSAVETLEEKHVSFR